MDGSKIFTALFLLTEVYSKAPPCNVPEGFPNARIVTDIDNLAHFSHGFLVEYKCDPGYFMINSDGRSTCDSGSWTLVECIRGCMKIPNADIYNMDKDGVMEKEPLTFVKNGQLVWIQCKEHFTLYKDGAFYETDGISSRCDVSSWSPAYSCKKDSCCIQVPDNGYLEINGARQKDTIKIDSGFESSIVCEEGFTFYDNDRQEYFEHFPVACVGHTLNASIPNCVEEPCTLPAIEYTKENEMSKQLAHNKRATVKCRFGYSMMASDVKIQNIETTCLVGNLAPSLDDLKCVPIGVDYGHYEEYDDYMYFDHFYEIKSEEACPDPANGRVVKSYLYYYNVVCTDGFGLVVLDNDVDYKCSNGKWISKNYEWEPECKELTCDITDEILAVMKVFKQVQGNEMYVSDIVREIQPDQEYYFECKQKNHEPVKRVFTCSGGNWTAWGRDPNWKMQIDEMEPSCRKAVCDPACQFGGTCVKDGMCKCVPGTKGKACEIPICNQACATNGGKCEAPNTCKCEKPHYGANCEQVGCGRPDLPEGVSMKGTKNFFKVGDVLSSDQLTCYQGYVLSNTVRCTGNHTWSGKAECLKETHYELEVNVGSRKWAGSYGSLYVLILSEQGRIIHRMFFEKPQFDGFYPGRSYTLSSSTTGQTDKVGQLKLLLGPGSVGVNDNLEIDHVRLTVQRAADNIIEDYTFSNVGWLDKHMPKFVRPDNMCLPPANVELYEKKPMYKTGDVIQRSNVICSHPSVQSTTCLKTGQWSPKIWCRKAAVFRLEYRLGDGYYAGSGDTFYISFDGSLGHTPSYLMSSGRRDMGKTYNTDIDGVYVGQIHTVTLTKQKVSSLSNDMQIDYIKLTVSHEDKEEEYMFRNVGWIGSRKETAITPDQPGLPSCQDDFVLSPGWVDAKLKRAFYTLHFVKSDEECKIFCRLDGGCKVAAVSGLIRRTNLICRLVYTDWESAFKSANDPSMHRLYKRKC